METISKTDFLIPFIFFGQKFFISLNEREWSCVKILLVEKERKN